MKIESFSPTTLKSALDILSRKTGIKILAGGTDFVVAMKQGIMTPQSILDLSKLNGKIREIKLSANKLHIGSLVTFTEIEESDLLRKYAPILVSAIESIGSVQIRNLGTIGGNIATSSPAGDSIPALFVLDAKLCIANKQEKKIIDIADFFVGPKRSILKPNELITEIIFPAMHNNEKGFFLKIGGRKALAISKVSVAGKIRFDKSNKIDDAKIALGAVAPTVIRAKRAEKLLIGNELTDKLIEECAEVASDECSPITDLRSTTEYRRKMVEVLVKRGLYTLQ